MSEVLLKCLREEARLVETNGVTLFVKTGEEENSIETHYRHVVLQFQGIVFVDKAQALCKCFDSDSEFLQWKSAFCKALLDQIKELDEYVRAETAEVLVDVLKFIIEIYPNIDPDVVVEALSQSSLCAHIFAYAPSAQNNVIVHHPVVHQLIKFFGSATVWPRIKTNLITLSFSQSAMLHFLRRFISSLCDANCQIIATEEIRTLVISSFTNYFRDIKMRSSAEEVLYYVQLLIPLMEVCNVGNADHGSFMENLIRFILTEIKDDAAQPQCLFKLKMYGFRAASVCLKHLSIDPTLSNQGLSDAILHLLSKSIFTASIFPKNPSESLPAGSVSEENHFKAIDISLRSLRLGGIHCTLLLRRICIHLSEDGYNHKRRQYINERLTGIVQNYAIEMFSPSAANAKINAVSSRHNFMEFTLFAIFDKESPPDYKELVMECLCLPYLLHVASNESTQDNVIAKIYLTEYKALDGKSLLHSLIFKIDQAGNDISNAYAFRILQVLYERLNDVQIKLQIVRNVPGFGLHNVLNATSISKAFLNGKETALTSLVNKKAKQCIDSSETNHFQKVTAYVCLAHMIIRTQKKISVQSQCLFSKYENVEKWWQFLILEEDYPSQPWCKTNNLLLETVVATLDTLFNKSAALPSDYGEDAWAEYADVNLDDSENSGPKKWVRVPNSPMPPFMDTMCKMACKVDSGVFLPMHIKIFLLCVIVQRPHYFQLFLDEFATQCGFRTWQMFVLDTLVQYGNLRGVSSPSFHKLFLKCTAILAQWEGRYDRSRTINTDQVVMEKFFNMWMKILAFPHHRNLESEMAHFESCLKAWTKSDAQRATKLDLSVVMDMFIRSDDMRSVKTTEWLHSVFLVSFHNVNSATWHRRSNSLKALALNLLSLSVEHLEWNWSSSEKMVDVNSFLHSRDVGILGLIFDGKSKPVRCAAASLAAKLARAGTVKFVDSEVNMSEFITTARSLLRMQYNARNQQHTTSLLESCVILGPQYTHQKRFIENLLSTINMLNHNNLVLALRVVDHVLCYYRETEHSLADLRVCVQNIYPSINRLAADTHTDTQIALLSILRTWTSALPATEWLNLQDHFTISSRRHPNAPAVRSAASAFIDHYDDNVRLRFYNLCISMDKLLVAEGKSSFVRPLLLYGLADKSVDIIQPLLYRFWHSDSSVSTAIKRAKFLIQKDVFEVGNVLEQTWSSYSCGLMLELLRSNVDYTDNEFLKGCHQPLDKANSFHSINLSNVRGSSQTQNQSYMEPLFATFVASLAAPSTQSVSMALDMEEEWNSQSMSVSNSQVSSHNVIRATQDASRQLFSLTQSTNSSVEQNLTSPNVRLQTNNGFAVPELPARFGNNENQNRAGSESKPVLTREYRVGELPDVQIKLRDMIDPLAKLCAHDNKVGHAVAVELIAQSFQPQQQRRTNRPPNGSDSVVREIGEDIVQTLNCDNAGSGNQDTLFVHSLLDLLSRITQSGARVAGIELPAVQSAAQNTLNHASGIVAIEDILRINESKQGWDSLAALYQNLNEEEIVQGLQSYGEMGHERAPEGGGSGSTSVPDAFESQFWEKLTQKQWHGLQGLLWKELETLLDSYNSLSKFAFAAKHNILKRLPLLITCQDFVSYYQRLAENNLEEDEKEFAILRQGWKKSWPSQIYDDPTVWTDLHKMRRRCLSELPVNSDSVYRSIIDSCYDVAYGLTLLNKSTMALDFVREAKDYLYELGTEPPLKDKIKVANIVFTNAKVRAASLDPLQRKEAAKYLSNAERILKRLEIDKLRDTTSNNESVVDYYVLFGNIAVQKYANPGLSENQKHGFIEEAIQSFKESKSPEGSFRCSLFLEDLIEGLTEEGRDNSKKEMYVLSFIEFTMSAINGGNSEAIEKMPRVLGLMNFPEAYGTFARTSETTPVWKFLSFIPLMFSLFREKQMKKTLCKILINMAQRYPQAVYYDYRVARSSLGKSVLPDNDGEIVIPLDVQFHKMRYLSLFAEAILNVAGQRIEINENTTMPLENVFLANLLHSKIEIPGQYRKYYGNTHSMPMPETHATISYVEETVLSK
jgi:hypothetical protein